MSTRDLQHLHFYLDILFLSSLIIPAFIGLFSSLLDALNKNSGDPEADLYSILDQLESYRTKNGFHFKLCYPELVGCNEWIQTSNPATQFGKATGFKAIKLAYATAGDNGEWKGIGRNPINHRTTLIDDSPPLSGYWWTAIGKLKIIKHGVSFYQNQSSQKT